MSRIEPAFAGPRRPNRRMALSEAASAALAATLSDVALRLLPTTAAEAIDVESVFPNPEGSSPS